jgi:hypothetical protein
MAPKRVILNNRQWLKLRKALLDGFPVYFDLATLLKGELGMTLDNIAAPTVPMTQVVYLVIQQVEAVNRTLELLEAARRNRPNNPEFFELARDIGIGLAAESDALEKLLNAQNILFDVTEFRRQLSIIESQVCRVEINGKPVGTGFLVGPSAVLTNYHVVESIVQEKSGYNPTGVALRFDYKMLDKMNLNPGKIYGLDGDWLIDCSPYSKFDHEKEPKSGVPQPDELDYALLRPQDSPGEDLVGEAGTSPERGCIQLPQPGTEYDYSTNKVLFIVQHPLGEPLKITSNTFRDCNENKSRLTYLNDTHPGSSGSPCFNANWELVALHHSGDPAFRPQYNEGIPIAQIVNLLNQRNVLTVIFQ